MFREALRYPLRGDDAVETLLVGGGLHLLAAFLPVVPLVFVAGYLVRVLAHASTGGRDALRGATDPPTFDDWRRLGRDGLAAVGIAAAYLLVPTVVLLVTVGGAVTRAGETGDLGAAATAGVLAGGTVTLFVALAFAYLLPAALANYAVERRLRAAFELRTIRRAAIDADYFVAWWAGVAVATVAAAVAAPLTPVVIGFFLAFYAEVLAAAVWGRGVAASTVAC
ncbi:DUF4013 domain-containing protein [Halegenticoccus tardaugens]|uniref:DUF4013 domain-containing protein n=1 Tax=Halegenticoccus tardaugens TaxID=2071624 RepID=UPI00100C03E9|nr:DUF4013 domain-containing protein [Halegenticoccus tardaugens]